MSEESPGSNDWTVDEWTTHILNIQGAIFERWAADAVRRSSPWTLTATEYPVEFPPSVESGMKGYESTLDLRADYAYPDKSCLTALIECKKNNPGFVDWVFFEAKRDSPPISKLFAHEIRWTQSPHGGQPTPQIVSREFELGAPVVDHASETRGTYDDPASRKNTKTSQQAINDACHQIAIATQAIAREESGNMYEDESPYTVITLLPVIVTTANLNILVFDPFWVDEGTGEIQRSKAELKPVTWLQYLYPLPRHLHFGGTPEAPWSELKKLPICIVNSRHFRKFLGAIATFHGYHK